MYIDDAFRPFWANGLNNIVVNNSKNLNDWIKDANDYQINSPVASDEFILNVYDRSLFLNPISQDCNRFSTSALESILKVDNLEILPKSICWILIKQYYSAFYSAHLILRLLGYSLTQLDGTTIASVRNVANIYGNLNGVNIENGYYLIEYGNSNNSLNCKKQNVNQSGGSHVTLWKLFGEKIKELNLEMLNLNTTSEVQDITVKLDELIYNLDYVGSNNHSWLSRMRNDFNYKHKYGVWHPYGIPKAKLDSLKRNINLWRSDVMDIDLKNHVGNELARFSNTCQFIIGLGNTICKDMHYRCSEGKSYLNSGYSKIINVA
ncbi:hypothetical protein AB9K26_00090 [Psychroserpens sp. XS_ASV72]|uniref:hypothetical protein n=1 Tax=Psychroserpens sp. XS_ASV72 TaxID=3241293 RepID=UPI0035147DEF